MTQRGLVQRTCGALVRGCARTATPWLRRTPLPRVLRHCRSLAQKSNAPLSVASIKQLLGDWQQQSAAYQGLPYQGTHLQLIEPYVLQRWLHGAPLNCLIANLQSRDWYDQVFCYTDIDLIFQLRMIQPGDVVFDLGANNGFYATMLARMAGPSGIVYAFDPFPLNAAMIRTNARLNQANIEVVEVGLGKTPQKRTIPIGNQCTALAAGRDDAHSLTITLT